MAIAAEVNAGASAPRTIGPHSVAITGASGFIGRALCRRLIADEVGVRALVRHSRTAVPKGCEIHIVGDLAATAHDWPSALRGVDTVFHLAAIAHSSTGDVRSVNVMATQALARATFACGARLVHVSSVKVYGDVREGRLTELAPLEPVDAYGQSKLEAERVIEEAALAMGGRWVALRPPIVYGPDERGNFARLIRLACSRVPLPFSTVDNRRSMIHVDVLVDALVRASTIEPVPNRSFVVAGGSALSTPEWLRAIAKSARRPLRLWPLPTAWMLAAATLLGARGIAQRLLGSLEVDDSLWRRVATWQPPIAQDDAIASAVRAVSDQR